MYGWTGGSACALLLYELLRDVWAAGPLMRRAALSVNRIPINRDIGRMRHFTHVRAQADVFVLVSKMRRVSAADWHMGWRMIWRFG